MADGSLARFLHEGRNQQFWLRVGLFLSGINGALAVMGLALGYHGVAINPNWIAQDIQLAAQFQLWHSLALLALILLGREVGINNVGSVMLMFEIGILCFSGGLYAIGFFHAEWGGKIAPYGGVAFMIGWLLLALMAFKRVRS